MSAIESVFRHVVRGVVRMYAVRSTCVWYVEEMAKYGYDMCESTAREIWEEYLDRIDEIDGEAVSEFYTGYILPPDLEEYSDRLVQLGVDAYYA